MYRGTLVLDLGSPLFINDPGGPRNMRDQVHDKERFLEELETRCTIQLTCQVLGIPRSTFYRWKSEDGDFRKGLEKALRRGEELVNDFAENTIINGVKQGDPGMTKYWTSKRHPKFKSVKEQCAIENKFRAKFDRFKIDLLGMDDIEY